MLIIVACHLARHYETVSRVIRSNSIRHRTSNKNFQHQKKALKERKNEGVIEACKIPKALAIIKWSEVSEDFMSMFFRTRTTPFLCVARYAIVSSVELPHLALSAPYLEDHGSVDDVLVERVLHDQPLSKDNDTKVCFCLEEDEWGA